MNNYDRWKLDNNESYDEYQYEVTLPTFIGKDDDKLLKFENEVLKLALHYGLKTEGVF